MKRWVGYPKNFIACRYCGAKAGQRCRTMNWSTTYAKHPHVERRRDQRKLAYRNQLDPDVFNE